MGILVRYKPSQKLCRMSMKLFIGKDPTEILKNVLASKWAKVALSSNNILSFSAFMYRLFRCPNAKHTAALPQVAIH